MGFFICFLKFHLWWMISFACINVCAEGCQCFACMYLFWYSIASQFSTIVEKIVQITWPSKWVLKLMRPYVRLAWYFASNSFLQYIVSLKVEYLLLMLLLLSIDVLRIVVCHVFKHLIYSTITIDKLEHIFVHLVQLNSAVLSFFYGWPKSHDCKW